MPSTVSAPAPVILPRSSWGDPSSTRSALLVHGLGSSGALMWRYALALADDGWFVTAVDLRGHGLAPRALDYTLAAYSADVAATTPAGAGPWDLVVAHSLGAAASVLAAAADPGWTRRLVLIDPAILLTDRDRATVRASLEQAFADPRADAIRRANPTWHPQDVELKATAVQQASVWAIEQTTTQNPAWDVRDAAAALTVPTHVIGADPAVFSLFSGDLAADVLENAAVTMSVVVGAGHSPHRDAPEAAIDALRAALT